MKRSVVWATLALLAFSAACAGSSKPGVGPIPLMSPAAYTPGPCGPPPPVPPPVLFLAYPEPGSTNVSVNIESVIVAGEPNGLYGAAQINMASTAGVSVAVGPLAIAPSPLPSPYATPQGGNWPYYSAPIPQLSSATRYTLTYTYTDFNGVPPSCTGAVTLPLGAFTTR